MQAIGKLQHVGRLETQMWEKEEGGKPWGERTSLPLGCGTGSSPASASSSRDLPLRIISLEQVLWQALRPVLGEYRAMALYVTSRLPPICSFTGRSCTRKGALESHFPERP